MQPKDFESQKCGIHGTWMTVYNDEGTYFPPILCLSRSKTIDKDYRSKTVGAALPLSSSAAPMLQLPVSDCCHRTSEDRIDCAVIAGSFAP